MTKFANKSFSVPMGIGVKDHDDFARRWNETFGAKADAVALASASTCTCPDPPTVISHECAVHGVEVGAMVEVANVGVAGGVTTDVTAGWRAPTAARRWHWFEPNGSPRTLVSLCRDWSFERGSTRVPTELLNATDCCTKCLTKLEKRGVREKELASDP